MSRQSIKILENMKKITMFVLCCAALWSCVPAKKYKALEADYQKASISNRGQENQTAYLENENKRLENELYTLKKQNDELRQTLFQQKSNYETALQQSAQQIQDLQAIQKQLVETSTMEANYNRQKLQKAQENTNIATTPNSNPSNNITINNNYPNGNTSEGAMRGGNPNNNANNFNKPTGSNLSKNLNDNNPTQTNTSTNSPQIFNLQNEVIRALSNFSPDNVQTKVSNNQLYITVKDDFLYEDNQNYSLTAQGKELLNSIGRVAKQQNTSNIVIDSEPSQSQTNNLGYSKAKSVAQFFASQNILYRLHNKNFSPLAFETTGTQSRDTQTILILSY